MYKLLLSKHIFLTLWYVISERVLEDSSPDIDT